MAYNGIGNITGKSGLGTYDYTEAGKIARPHAVQNVKKNGRKTLDLEYDDFGNVTRRSGDDVEGGSQDIEYSSFNLPTQVTLGSGTQVRYQYDASQERVLVDVGDCTDPTSSTCNRRVYAGEAYERQTATDEAGTFTRDIYKVFAGGQQVAQVQRESRSASSTETRRFIHGDHLGSSMKSLIRAPMRRWATAKGRFLSRAFGACSIPRRILATASSEVRDSWLALSRRSGRLGESRVRGR